VILITTVGGRLLQTYDPVRLTFFVFFVSSFSFSRPIHSQLGCCNFPSFPISGMFDSPLSVSFCPPQGLFPVPLIFGTFLSCCAVAKLFPVIFVEKEMFGKRLRFGLVEKCVHPRLFPGGAGLKTAHETGGAAMPREQVHGKSLLQINQRQHTYDCCVAP